MLGSPRNRAVRHTQKPKDPRKELVKGLLDGYRYRPHELLRWLLDDVLCHMGKPNAHPCPEEVRGRIEDLGHWYALTVASEAPFTDVLGPVYMDLVAHGAKQWLGQFFTPQSIAVMMAEFQMTDPAPKPETGSLIKVSDPACGSGVMLLSTAQVVHRRSESGGVARWSFTGIDLDGICARMTAVQLLANNAVHGIEIGEVVVYHGDALWPDKGLETIVHATGASVPVDEVVSANSPERITAAYETARQTQQSFLSASEQMNLELLP